MECLTSYNIFFLYLVDKANVFQCFNGDRHQVSAKCDGIVDCVGSTFEDELETCGKREV